MDNLGAMLTALREHGETPANTDMDRARNKPLDWRQLFPPSNDNYPLALTLALSEKILVFGSAQLTSGLDRKAAFLSRLCF